MSGYLYAAEKCSIMSDSLQPYGPHVAHQAPLSMGFFQARILEWVAISLHIYICKFSDIWGYRR